MTEGSHDHPTVEAVAAANRTMTIRNAHEIAQLRLEIGGGVNTFFGPHSPWNQKLNRPLDRDSPLTHAIRATPNIGLNTDWYSHPIYFAGPGDRHIRFNVNGREVPIILPENAEPANGTDAHMYIVDPDREYVDEFWMADVENLTANAHVRTNIHGTGVGRYIGDYAGVRAYGGSGIGGLILKSDRDAGVIPHALAIAATNAQLKSGPIWPATMQDYGGETEYKGPAPMGSLFSLVTMPTHLETDLGRMIATAAYDYGCYLVDRSGRGLFYGEPGLVDWNAIDWRDLWQDISVIWSYLAVVVQ